MKDDVTFTTARAHGFRAGDQIRVDDGRYWRELWRLLTRPRVQYVGDVDGNTFQMLERRMSWREWCSALRRHVMR